MWYDYVTMGLGDTNFMKKYGIMSSPLKSGSCTQRVLFI